MRPLLAPPIYQEFKSTDVKYKSRLRSRISNLKDQKNPDLRRNVLCGNISPERIANMSAEVRLLWHMRRVAHYPVESKMYLTGRLCVTRRWQIGRASGRERV